MPTWVYVREHAGKINRVETDRFALLRLSLKAQKQSIPSVNARQIPLPSRRLRIVPRIF